ncbi:PAS domain-containing protein [Kiloniella antarctica]|uniref:PAS domain-containing protein n=1 Tax=Kiloniella antarctica TaxID=1550907 RepID=A0ABW5BQR6_9PROT
MAEILNGDLNHQRDDNFDWIRRYDVDVPYLFNTQVVQKLFDWWCSFHPNLPNRQDFNISDHSSIASHLYLIKLHENNSFEYRLNGENVINLVGYSMKGIIFDKTSTSPSQRVLAQYCEEVMSSQVCKRCTGEIRLSDTRKVAFESLDCPLINENNEVGYTLGVMSTIENL